MCADFEFEIHPAPYCLPPGAVACSARLPAQPGLGGDGQAASQALARGALQFARGRAAARAALERLGFGPGALRRLPGGLCEWPAESLGSISHELRASHVAVARAAAGRGLGIDSQALLPAAQASELLRLVADAGERDRLQTLPDPTPEGSLGSTLLFSAKEAFYKALCCALPQSIGGAAMEFTAVQLQACVPVGPGRWQLVLHPARWLGLPVLSAQAVLARGCVHTSVWIGCWG